MYHVCFSMLQRATTLAVVAVAAGIVLQPSQLSASILDKCCDEKNLDCMHYGRSNQVSPFEFSVRVNSGALLTLGSWTSAKNARSNRTLWQRGGEGAFDWLDVGHSWSQTALSAVLTQLILFFFPLLWSVEVPTLSSSLNPNPFTCGSGL